MLSFMGSKTTSSCSKDRDAAAPQRPAEDAVLHVQQDHQQLQQGQRCCSPTRTTAARLIHQWLWRSRTLGMNGVMSVMVSLKERGGVAGAWCSGGPLMRGSGGVE